MSTLGKSAEVRKKCLIESSAQSISDKLRKEYCKRDIPTILAVSLAAFSELISFNDLSFGKDMAITFLKAIKENSTKKEKQINFTNLYAIIIDTAWYNWFPHITIQEPYNAHFPNGYENCYGIIYNSDLATNNKLFGKSIPYNTALSFSGIAV